MVIIADSKQIIVTSALPYANGPLHIGHLVEYIQTDIFVRFLRLRKENVKYICADDTHGTPIELKSRELAIKPEELIERFHKEHSRDFATFGISFDNYYSTNSKENKHFSDLIFTRLKENGWIYTKDIQAMYSEKSKRFLPDRFIKGDCPRCEAPDQYGDVCESCGATYKPTDLKNPYSVIDGDTPVLKTSKHYFFKLSEFAARLKEWLETNEDLQQEAKNFALHWIEKGLEDWDISRDGPYFGFRIPGEEDKYYYVWLDAPIGYIASFANLIGDLEEGERQWNGSEIIHFIGKDIMYFHLLFWPAMLMGSGFQLPKTIAVHGFLTVNGEKMSKSRGTFFTAEDFARQFEPEHLRYYFASGLVNHPTDLDLDIAHLQSRINNELVANLGNFCYRVLSFTNKHFEGQITELDEDNNLQEQLTLLLPEIARNYENLNYKEVLRLIMRISDLGNQYFQKNEPWKLVKEDREKTQKICATCVNLIKSLSILVAPILPVFSQELQKQLNVSGQSWEDLDFSLTDHTLGKAEILVQKMEEAKEQGEAQGEDAGGKSGDVFPLNLKVAEILSAENHPDADKLLVLQLDLGTEKRQLVAGLKEHYGLDELVGKRIVMITNLKYAKLRGVESQGMLLAGDDGEHVGVVNAASLDPGAQVLPAGFTASTDQIAFDQFQKIRLSVKDAHPSWEGRELLAGGKSLSVEKVKDGARIR